MRCSRPASPAAERLRSSTIAMTFSATCHEKHAMKQEWLTERCESLTAHDVRLREMAGLDLSEENKQKLLERSDQLKRWEATKWLPFIADLMPDDEVWRFHSPPETWAKFCGCAGYVVIRDGQIIRSLTTMRN